MLRPGHLVVGLLHRDTDGLQVGDDAAPELAAAVEGGQVEVCAGVERLGPLRRGEEEELDLGAGIEGVPELAGSTELALQHLPGIAGEGGAIRRQDVAEHPGLERLRPPGQDLERLGVGLEEHVRLLHPGEAVDGRPVEPHPFQEGLGQFGRGKGQRLEHAQHIDEPEADEMDAAFFDRAQDEGDPRFCLRRHGCPPSLAARWQACNLTSFPGPVHPRLSGRCYG